MWMTGTSTFEASFRDLAIAVGLDYCWMKRGKSIADISRLLRDAIPELLYQEDSIWGPKGSMQRFLRILYEILRHTIVPFAAIEGCVVGHLALEAICAALAGDELNVLEVLVDRC
jgi:hypothetical protein